MGQQHPRETMAADGTGRGFCPSEADAPAIQRILAAHGTRGMSISTLGGGGASSGFCPSADLCVGTADEALGIPMTPSTWVEVASLSKTIAAAFALEYFGARGVSMETPVNAMLEAAGSSFRLRSAPDCPPEWADAVQLRHLVDHTGLGMHYVRGIPRDRAVPSALALISGAHASDLGYEALRVAKEPGKRFGYSGGGFLVLQHLLEALEGDHIDAVARDFLDACGMRDFSFRPEDPGRSRVATGYFDDGRPVPGGRLNFPALAAGGIGTTRSLAAFWRCVTDAYAAPGLRSGAPGRPISHATAAAMLDTAADKGSGAFMNAKMGMGAFVVDAGRNRVAIHQAANEGFRGVYVVVFDGPDRGKGYVIVANGDNESAIAIAETLQYLLIHAGWEGVDASMLRQRQGFDFTGIKQEEIVNYAFKALVFDAFEGASPRARL